MTPWLLLLLALSLSVDAFVVSLGVGLACCRFTFKAWRMALFIGAMHTLFVLAGAFAFRFINDYIEDWSSYIAAAIFAVLGIKMIVEAFENKENEAQLTIIGSLIVAVAVSIDALAVGGALEVSHNTDITLEATVIGTTAMVATILGFALGRRVGKRFGSRAMIAGGIALTLIAIKTLIQY